MRRLAWIPLMLAALVVGFASAQGLERTMTITMGEMFFQQEGMAQNEAIMLETGVPYRITFTNVGALVHRVKFGRGLIVEEGVPFAYSENLFDNLSVKIVGTGDLAGMRVIADELIELDLDAGKSVEVVFTLPLSAQGTWELGCFVVGHYEAGMLAPLVVQ